MGLFSGGGLGGISLPGGSSGGGGFPGMGSATDLLNPMSSNNPGNPMFPMTKLQEFAAMLRGPQAGAGGITNIFGNFSQGGGSQGSGGLMSALASALANRQSPTQAGSYAGTGSAADDVNRTPAASRMSPYSQVL